MAIDTGNIIDNLLVLKIRDNNNIDAFKLLYDRYSSKLYYYSLKYLGSKEESEDLVQSVFINLWEHRKSLDERLPVKYYIYRSAVNYIFNFLKKKAVRARFIETKYQSDIIYSNITYDQIYYQDLERSINSIIETFPSQQQRIFKLSRFEGLTHEEIASKLELSVRTVENQIYRALKIIRNRLKDKML